MCAKLYQLKISLAISHKIGVSQQHLSSSLGFWGASDSPAESSCVWWHLSSLWDHHVCWRGQQTEPCAWLKSVAVSQTGKRQYRRPGCPWLPRGSCGSPGVQRALGCRGCCWLGASAQFGCSASATPSFRGFTAVCLTQLWTERACISSALHFSHLARWQSSSCQSQGRLCFSVHNFRVSPLCFWLQRLQSEAHHVLLRIITDQGSWPILID